MKSFCFRLAILGVLATSFGCSTSSQIIVNPAAQGRSFRSAHLIPEEAAPDDVDASIQRGLMRRGLAVSIGASEPEDVDLVVRYVDEWKWDISMYLNRLDLQFYDAESGTLLASAGWKNSALHGYHGLDKVVTNLIDEVMLKLGSSR